METLEAYQCFTLPGRFGSSASGGSIKSGLALDEERQQP